MPISWEIEFKVPYGDEYLPVRIHSMGWDSFDISVNKLREGSIGWMRYGWKFHTHKNTSLTTADFIEIADIIWDKLPGQFKAETLGSIYPRTYWVDPPRVKPHWALLMYPKWPNVRYW